MSDSNLRCVVPGCKAELTPKKAFLPELSAVAKVEGKRPGQVTVADLARHLLCGGHGDVARKSGVKTFRYVDTVDMLERREAERVEAGKFLQMYAPLKAIKDGNKQPSELETETVPS